MNKDEKLEYAIKAIGNIEWLLEQDLTDTAIDNLKNYVNIAYSKLMKDEKVE